MSELAKWLDRVAKHRSWDVLPIVWISTVRRLIALARLAGKYRHTHVGVLELNAEHDRIAAEITAEGSEDE